MECGKCLRYCPIESPEYHNKENPVCHAINATDEIRKMQPLAVCFLHLQSY